MYYEFDKKTLHERIDSTERRLVSVRQSDGRILHHVSQQHESEDEDLQITDGDDDVFMESFISPSSKSLSSPDSASLYDDEFKPASTMETNYPKDSYPSSPELVRTPDSVPLSPGRRLRSCTRLLRRRCLFPKNRLNQNNRELLTTSANEPDDVRRGSLRVSSSDDDSASSDFSIVSEEQLVTLSHEKLRSYSTDFHSNSNGLRNRVLVESTLRKFFLNEVSSPPRPPITAPSTPRKRSFSSSPLTSESPGSTSDHSSSGDSSHDDDEEATTRTLSDSIKRMKIKHSISSCSSSSGLFSPPPSPSATDHELDVVQSDDYSMTDLASVFRKIHCLTDLPIDADF